MSCTLFEPRDHVNDSKRLVALFSAATVCGVCAREIDAGTRTNEDTTPRRLEALPNSQCLVPRLAHPAHDLFDGKLLEPAGVVREGNATKVRVCRECSESLIKNGDHPPKHALANNLWIGRTPWQLQILTFPEQLLIALLYPRVYVFKLHPRCPGRKDPSTLQRGMKGTVSTYDLDSDGIASMLAGDLMPRPPAVLASVISVTYIGLGELPKNWLRSTFRVRRKAVFDALRWLKENNPKYYGDIRIDMTRVAALPEDDVPLEITSIVRQSTDTGIVDQESDGYTVNHDLAAGAATPGPSNQINGSVLNQESSEVEADMQAVLDSDAPDVIPLQVTGTIDTDLSELTSNEMMA
ncbi:hypothetical protein R3P38DRAFT_3239546 [Favolaschia claudopus]|uniref:DUF6570 domain-containing protein n=1 Tax=Favolaschia claudopus TaxID=2862362 RepID=A0AAV9Z7X6_9AGAR